MRLLLIALALVLTLMYFTFGLRFGYVTLTPTYMFNATGENSYAFRIYEDGKSVGVTGSCDVRSGTATFRLLDSKGTQLAGQVCPKGTFALNVVAGGREGNYELKIHLEKFSGMIDIHEVRNERSEVGQ